jgi:hypothetical protein
MVDNWGKVLGAEVLAYIKKILVRLILDGQKIAKAGRFLGIKQETASKIWKKYQITGSITNLKCSGHPKKLTTAIACKVFIDAKRNC